MSTHKKSPNLIKLIRQSIRYNPKTGKCFWLPRNDMRKDLLKKEAGGMYSTGSPGDHPRWRICVHGYRVCRSRIAFICMTGRFPKYVDHINGKVLDDRWVNLREVSNAQNGWNRGPVKRGKTSGLPTRVKRVRTGMYVASIQANKKHYHLGTFDTPEKAYAAYLRGKKKIHGGFGLQFFK